MQSDASPWKEVSRYKETRLDVLWVRHSGQKWRIRVRWCVVGPFKERFVRFLSVIIGKGDVSGADKANASEGWDLPLRRKWYSTKTVKNRVVIPIVRLVHTDLRLICLQELRVLPVIYYSLEKNIRYVAELMAHFISITFCV